MLSKTNSTMAVIVLLIICSSAFGQTVIATYEIHDHASGLAYDGENIWYGRYGTGGEWVYKFDTQLGAVTDSIDLGATNLDDAYGLTWDGQYLWTISHTGSDFIIKFDTAGNIVQAFPTPSNYMSGLAWNGTDFYMSDYYEPDGAIYKVDVNGQIIENFTAPDTQPWDLAWDGQNLWMCDYWSDWIYQIDPVTHETLFSFESPITEPAGIAWDGQYLWVSDEGDGYNIDHLYIIAPFGAGTPGIEISAEELDFGFVPTGMTPSMEFLITSIGDADLTVSDIGLSGFNLAFFVDSTITYPFSLSPGENRSVSVYYSPFQFGESFGTVHVHSDDPINPEVTVDLSGYGIYPDQTVSVSTTYIDYGEVWIARLDGLTGEPLEIDNKGAVPLYLISVEIDDPAFYCTGFTPGNLASMDTLALTVYFEPELPQTYSGVLSLTTDDPVQPVVEIQLQGYGNYASFGTGDVIWFHEADPSTFDGFNSIKYMDDVNGDGIPEVIAANDNYLTYCINGQSDGEADVFWIFDTGIDPMRTGNVEYERGMVPAPDLNNDGMGDVVIGTTGGSRSVFAVSGADGQEIWGFDTHDYGGEGGWVYEVTCEADWNNDGIFDVLAAVGGPSGSIEPKSVFCLDGTDGSVIWRAHIEQTVYSVRALGDLNGDGYSEVICGTSPASGTYYVKCLNGANGNTIWTTEVDNVVFSLNAIEDLDGDGFNDAAVAAAFGGVYALSGTNGDEIWHVTGYGSNYYLEVTGNLNGSGTQDILVTSVSGYFMALEGATGHTIWQNDFGTNVLSLSATEDTDGDGVHDACCGVMDGSFHAVSGIDGDIIFSDYTGGGTSYAFDAVGWMPDIDNSGAIEFLSGGRNGMLYCYSGGEIVTEVENPVTASVPAKFDLSAPYPNPFNNQSTISYSLAENSIVKLSILNIMGEEITVLREGYAQAGSYSVSLDAKEMASGVYFARLISGGRVSVEKMILLK